MGALKPTGITGSEAFGTAYVYSLIRPTGIASTAAVGTPQQLVGIIRPTGLESLAFVGSPVLGPLRIRLIVPGSVTTRVVLPPATIERQ